MELKTALVALAATPLMLSVSWAACPMGSTVSLVSPPAAGQALLTDADINAKLASLQAGTLELTGNFNINNTIALKSCVTLTTAAASASLAKLTWTGGSKEGELIVGVSVTDVALNRLKLVGRGVALGAFLAGDVAGNNFTVSDTVFENVAASNPAKQENYILKLGSGSNWRITGNTFTISPNRPDLRNVPSTGIIGWHLDKITVNLNQFNGIDAGVHLKDGLTNARITNNTVKDLSGAGLEFETGELINNPNANAPYANNLVSGNRITNWRPGAVGMGISVTRGQNWTVQDNLVVRKGYTLADCKGSLTIDEYEYGALGMEFTATNSTAKANTLCGFNTGISLGIGGPVYAGVDLSTLDGNTIINSNFAIRLVLFANDAVRQKKAKIVNNVIQEARVRGISGANLWAEPGHYMVGAEGALYGLTIAGNTLTRTTRTDDADGNAIQQGPANAAYTAIQVRPLAVPGALSITGNTIKLLGNPYKADVAYQGVALTYFWSDGFGATVAPSSYAGAQVSGNIISSQVQAGVGIAADRRIAPTGATLSANSFNNLVQSMTFDVSGVTVSGNTCTSVVDTKGCTP